MAFDGIVVADLVHEFRNELIGGRIAKIAQPETDELLLTIKTNDGQRRLLISADASLPLIYLTDANKPAPMTAPNFCMLLRKHIGGGRIVDIRQPKLERIIHFTIEHLDELGDLCRKELIVEIMGKHSNIIFCTSDGKIIDSIKHVSAQMSSVREVLPGREYFIPDTMHKADPLTVDADTFTGLLKEKPMPVSKAVYTSFTGISPVTAEEICHLAGLDSAIPAKEYSEDILFHLYTQFTIYLSAIKEGRFTPAIYYDGREPKEFAALPLTHFDMYECREYASISEVLSTFYSTRSLLMRIRQKSADSEYRFPGKSFRSGADPVRFADRKKNQFIGSENACPVLQRELQGAFQHDLGGDVGRTVVNVILLLFPGRMRNDERKRQRKSLLIQKVPVDQVLAGEVQRIFLFGKGGNQFFPGHDISPLFLFQLN